MFKKEQSSTKHDFSQIKNQLNPGVKNNVEKLHCNISNKPKAFTLVELIIVVTILGILATIAFISFQGYTKNARDGNRLSTLSNISKGIEVYLIQTGKTPEPDGTIMIGTLSGTQLTKVGNISENITRLIKLNTTPTDPVGGNNYAYGISSDNKYYQVGTTLENLEAYKSMIKETYADNGNYRAKVIGNYNYPLKLGNKLYSLPSLLYTGTGGELTQSGNYFIVDNWLNIPYHPDGTLNNTRSISEALQNITGTSGLALTGITIPTVTSDDFKNPSYDLGDLTKLGITDKDKLGQIIYGNGYVTDKNVGAINGGNSGGGSSPSPNSCASPTPSGAGIATTTIGSPTSVNQAWVKSAPNCGFTCTSGYTGSNCEILPVNTITYNGNGATSGSMTNQTGNQGASVTLTTNAFTRTNYTFLGWSTNSSATTASYTNGQSYTLSGNVTLYAVWQTAILNEDGTTAGTYLSDTANSGNRFEWFSGSTPGGTSIVRDKITGLYWQSGYPGGYITWAGAKSYCAGLNTSPAGGLGGLQGWRLPDKTELFSIVDYSKYNPSIDTAFFTSASSGYWSSTTYAYFTDYAWLVSFSFGSSTSYGKTGNFYVRCVR